MTSAKPTGAPLPLAVLILARDEADVLEGTLRSMRASLGAEDHVHVVADHCHDATAAVARRLGAAVHVREARHGSAGKGQALRWWLDQTAGTHDGDRPVVILDADSLPAQGFFEAMRHRLASGQPAVQALIEPALRTETAIGSLAAYSEIVEQRVFDRARAAVGWPVRVRGTGMAFSRPLLERAAAGLSTLVEDVELTLILGAWGVSISLALETSVGDPKPPDSAGAIRQRARWLRGQLHASRAHAREIGRLLLRGPAGWSLLSSALLKPKSFFLPFKAGVAVAASVLYAASRSPGGLALAAWSTISLVLDVLGLLWGLRLIHDRADRLRLLKALPLYLWMWLRSLALSAVTRERWLRSRPVGATVRTSELPGEP